jgi:tetratricopeptide (TPR) repeat protein
MFKNFVYITILLFILTGCIKMKERSIDHYISGTAKAEKGDIQGAMVDFDKSIELNPEFAMAYHNRGYYCRLAMGNLQGALEDFTASIEASPVDNDAYSLSMRSFVKLQMKDIAGALKDVTASIDLDPSNSFAYRNRALIALAQTDTLSCINDLKKARALGFTTKFGTEVDELLGRLTPGQ